VMADGTSLTLFVVSWGPHILARGIAACVVQVLSTIFKEVAGYVYVWLADKHVCCLSQF
jgi:hypothetical protein